MRVHERDPQYMISEKLLERVEDFAFEGRTILASRLGYRITPVFVERFLGRLFETPDAVFPEELLRPEKQSLELFAQGVDAIVDAQRRVALNHFEDGSVDPHVPRRRRCCTSWRMVNTMDWAFIVRSFARCSTAPPY